MTLTISTWGIVLFAMIRGVSKFDRFGVMLLEDNFGILYEDPKSTAKESRMNFIYCGLEDSERSGWFAGGCWDAEIVEEEDSLYESMYDFCNVIDR